MLWVYVPDRAPRVPRDALTRPARFFAGLALMSGFGHSIAGKALGFFLSKGYDSHRSL